MADEKKAKPPRPIKDSSLDKVAGGARAGRTFDGLTRTWVKPPKSE